MTDPINFTPLETFHDADLRSSYVVGFNYTLRDRVAILGDAEVVIPAAETPLGKKLPGWIEAGKVRLGTADGSDSARASVKGVGSVK